MEDDIIWKSLWLQIIRLMNETQMDSLTKDISDRLDSLESGEARNDPSVYIQSPPFGWRWNAEARCLLPEPYIYTPRDECNEP